MSLVQILLYTFIVYKLVTYLYKKDKKNGRFDE